MYFLDKFYLPLLLFVVSTLAFFQLSEHRLYEWDESHTAINAVEMMYNGDIFNLYYAGQPDELRAKPPLFIWMVVGAFELFGINKWSLRLPSALATIAIFGILFQLIAHYRSRQFAFMTCLILLPVKAIIGFHVGRTGDFDAVLLMCLLAALHQLLQYLDPPTTTSPDVAIESAQSAFGSPHHLHLSAVGFGLAFWIKGPAMAVLSPGILLYLLLTRRLRSFLNHRAAWRALGITLLFPVAWFAVVHFFGVKIAQPQYAGADSFERMFLYDLLERFTDPGFEDQTAATWGWYFFRCLDESFIIWNYVFFIVLGGGIWYFFRQKEKIYPFPSRWKLLVLSTCIWTTLGLFLSVVTTAKWWYLAPAFPFVAITTYWGIDALHQYLQKRYHWHTPTFFSAFSITHLLFLLLICASMLRRYRVSLQRPDYPLSNSIVNYCATLSDVSDLAFAKTDIPRQDILGALYLCHPHIRFRATDYPSLSNRQPSNTWTIVSREVFDREMKGTEKHIAHRDNFYVILAPAKISSQMPRDHKQ